MKKSLIKTVLLCIGILFIIIQFFRGERNQRVETSHNAIEAHYEVPSKVQGILKTSCYDCHSNNTTYPWYSNIQPVGWWLTSHVNEGKEHLNFDEFNSYSLERKLHKLDEIVETINKGEMPLSSYTLIHGNAKLSDTDKKDIEQWVNVLKNSIHEK